MSENGDVRQELLWQMQSEYTVMMNLAPIILGNNLQLGTYANSAALRTALLQWCYSSQNFGANPTVSAGTGTGADDDNRMQVDSLKKGNGKGKGKHAKPERQPHIQATRAIHASTRARTAAELHIGRKTAGDLVEEPTTNPPVTTSTHRKARTTRGAEAKANKWTLWKRISPLKQPQKHRARSWLSRAIQTSNRKVGSWVSQSILFLPQRDKLVQSFCFLTVVHSFTPVQSHVQDKKVPLPAPGFHTASGARLQHDGGRQVTFKLPEGRTVRVLFHACEVQKPIPSLGCLAQQGCWSDLRADTGPLFFPDKIKTKHGQTQLHKEESLFFVNGMLVAPLSTAGVSDEVAQESHLPAGPQMLDDVEEPMPARPATLKDPSTPDQIVLEQKSRTHFSSQPWCVESRGRDSPHREQSKFDAIVPQLQF